MAAIQKEMRGFRLMIRHQNRMRWMENWWVGWAQKSQYPSRKSRRNRKIGDRLESRKLGEVGSLGRIEKVGEFVELGWGAKMWRRVGRSLDARER